MHSTVHRAGDGGYGLGRNQGGNRAAKADGFGGHSIQPIPTVGSFGTTQAKNQRERRTKDLAILALPGTHHPLVLPIPNPNAAVADASTSITAPWGVHARLVGMAILWGASWPAGRILAQAMPPMSAAASRFTIASVLLLIWLRLAQGAWPTLTAKQWRGLVLGAAVGVFAYAVLFMMALQRVDASRAALVVTTNPVFTTLLAAWLFGERMNVRIALGMVFALLGATIVLTHGEPWMIFSGALGWGEVMLLGCVAGWTGYTLIGKGMLSGIDSLVTTTFTAVIGTVMLWVAAMTFEGPATMSAAVQALTPGQWGAMVFIAIGSTVIAYAWYNRGIAELGAGTAASYISLVPVFGVASSVVWLGERLDGALMVGGALAILGLVISNLGRRG